MFKNYLKITLRNIKRHKAYSLINILGLAIGIALCVLILVYVQDELSYDNFHENGDRIYRIVELEDHDGDLLTYMRIGPGVTEKLKVDFPDSVENTVRLLPADDVWTKFEDKLFQEDRVFRILLGSQGDRGLDQILAQVNLHPAGRHAHSKPLARQRIQRPAVLHRPSGSRLYPPDRLQTAARFHRVGRRGPLAR